MSRYVKFGKDTTFKSGSTCTFDSGSTLTISGTLSGAAVDDLSTLDTTGNVHIGGTCQIVGNTKVGTHDAEPFSITAATGAVSALSVALTQSAAADAIAVNTNKFTVKGASGNTVIAGTLDAGTTGHFGIDANGIITLSSAHTPATIDAHTAAGTLNLTDTTVKMTGNGVVTGTLDVGAASHFNVNADGVISLNAAGTMVSIDGHTVDGTITLSATNGVNASKVNSLGTTNSVGDFTVGAVGVPKLTITAATGNLTLANSMVVNCAGVDRVDIGALIGICNDNSPAAVATNGVVLYWDGTNLQCKRQSDGKVSVITGHTAADEGAWA